MDPAPVSQVCKHFLFVRRHGRKDTRTSEAGGGSRGWRLLWACTWRYSYYMYSRWGRWCCLYFLILQPWRQWEIVGQDQPASADQVNTLLAKHAAELESGQREHAAELDKLDDYTRFSRDEWDHYSREYVNETRFALTDSPSSTWRRGADDARPGPRVRAERSAICDLRSAIWRRVCGCCTT